MKLPKNIVIVEDEAITQRYLREILEAYKVNIVGCFDNAKDAMQVLDNIDVDMILMDININGDIDGIQMARKILQANTIPIVFITAYCDDDTLEEVLELSPYGFIAKPFSSQDVLIAIKVAYKQFLMHETTIKKTNKSENIVINEYYTFLLETSTLYCKNEVIKLTFKQNQFLKLLVENSNHTVSYETIISVVWGTEDIADSTLRTLVYNIRKLATDLPLHSYSKKGYYLTFT